VVEVDSSSSAGEFLTIKMLISSTLALVSTKMDFINHFRYVSNSLIIGPARQRFRDHGIGESSLFPQRLSRAMEDDVLNRDALSRPLTGAYYWVPIPPLGSPTWSVVTCHDLGFDEDRGHPTIWLAVIPRLAAIWGRDPRAMRRRLGRHCYGLFRGRVTRLEKVHLINHGNDSPIPEWTEAVAQAFNLLGRRVKPVFDEHEQTLPDDVNAITRILGPFLTPAEAKAPLPGP
jgi:hypothetical protein